MDTAAAQFEHLKRQVEWLKCLSSDLVLPADERALIAVGCLDVATEHHSAIAHLYDWGLYGSAYALLRVLVESLIRGMWLARCATDQQISNFKKSGINRHFKELVADIETELGASELLAALKSDAWKIMNGFTHTGFHQVARRHSPGKLEPSYSEKDRVFLLLATELFGAVAYGEMITISQRQDLMSEFRAKVHLFTGSPKASKI